MRCLLIFLLIVSAYAANGDFGDSTTNSTGDGEGRGIKDWFFSLFPEGIQSQFGMLNAVAKAKDCIDAIDEVIESFKSSFRNG